MATTFSTGTQSPTSHKTLEKIFEEAQSTGAVCLCGRKLREYPKISSRYDLIDTISADLSKNRFAEVPKEVCDHAMLEELNCYHNVIKAIPEAIGRLQNLTFINLSRNQLVVIPPFICELVSLEVLIASHNKLISLPEEMGVLDKLMEIDVSCNEISQLPPQIGDLKSLKSLNVRRNMLIELPIELSKLSLRKIDFSNNRISTIPTAFRKIETLEEILLDSNPLTMPPAHLCTKGKKHIMKYLQIEAIKEDRRRGVLNEAEMKRLVRKSLPVTQTSDEFRNILESPEKWKRHTVLSSDSGYSTTDSIEKCGWSASDANSDMERANLLALRSAEMLKDHRVPINGHMQSPPHVYARKSENSPSSNPEQVKTSVPQNTYGQYGNNYKDSSGHYNNTDYQSNNVNGPMMYRSNFSNSSNENQNYSQNTYSNSPVYSQSSAIYSQNNEVTSPNSSRQQPQYSSQSSNNLQQYGQYTTNNGQRSESKYTPMSPTHSRYTTSPNTFQYTSQLNSGQNVNYRVKPPPVVTNQEFNPEASPTSPRTPKTPTPGYYQSGQVYSPTYGGYSTGPNSPNAPITPVNTTPKDMENEISRELQRQQADYNRKKQQAEQIRMQHEEELRRQEDEEEKENRRRAALRLQEEQRMLLERQMEEERQREELRLQEERRQQEEAHRKEEQRKREEIRSLEDQKRKEEEHKQKQEAQQYKVENNYGYNQGWHDRPGIRYNGHTAESFGMQYSGPLSPSSSSPSTPLISPSPSPRSSVSSAGPSPASSSTSLNKDPKSAGGSIPRRPRTIDKNPAPSSRPSHGNVSRPSTTSTLQSSRTASRTTGVTNSAVKKNHVTPEEEFRQKHQQIKTQTQVESQKAKSQLESSTSRQRTSMSTTVPRSTNSTLSKRGGTVLTNSAIKAIESYKDSDPNYTIRRQMEHEHGEAKQIDCLRRTIESRLKVTLPDNLPETLRDGVLLCQLANSIRPRSVTSIHVPSPAVPKLTLAKCRKNVENFLEACRKLGVHRDNLCACEDIVENLRPGRVALTVQQLAMCRRITTTDYYISYFCIFIFCTAFALLCLYRV
ncbi:leucine-rich repeat and calponin homology domain-containing protein 1-like isoform X8 [Mytilus californianus]|uniref:leucine-rich repeat and calponin homology domain-containing protein 1-like isoform X8 n=1 Tax=Mytilus californianus TaxID=6549 RepID=UPI002246143F|nr:leucine-rich repeat and calponin homology domain-containing protein 1-like isoform X8 [Mytilus californianus]